MGLIAKRSCMDEVSSSDSPWHIPERSGAGRSHIHRRWRTRRKVRSVVDHVFGTLVYSSKRGSRRCPSIVPGRCDFLGCMNVRGRLAQLVRAPALQAGGRRFESCTAHQSFQRLVKLSSAANNAVLPSRKPRTNSCRRSPVFRALFDGVARQVCRLS